MEEAIKIAQSNGWEAVEGWHFQDDTVPTVDIPNIIWIPAEICLDPFFWQALGKGLKWGKKMISDRGIRHRDIPIYYWYGFIDHLAEGKDINSFFKELLTNHK